MNCFNVTLWIRIRRHYALFAGGTVTSHHKMFIQSWRLPLEVSPLTLLMFHSMFLVPVLTISTLPTAAVSPLSLLMKTFAPIGGRGATLPLASPTTLTSSWPSSSSALHCKQGVPHSGPPGTVDIRLPTFGVEPTDQRSQATSHHNGTNISCPTCVLLFPFVSDTS